MGFVLRGETDAVLCEPNPAEATEPSRTSYFCPELLTSDVNARAQAPAFPIWARHTLKPVGKRQTFIAADAIQGMGSWIGGDLFVSQTAAQALASHLKGQCIFVPAALENAPEPYYLLWVTTIVDALDEQRSMTKTVAESERKRVYEYVFREDAESGPFIFRLPGARYTLDSLENCCSDRFVELVASLGLDGFNFSTGNTARSRSLTPVPLRKQATRLP
jgi:hypothetical protein